jgi:hypothetical protein
MLDRGAIIQLISESIDDVNKYRDGNAKIAFSEDLILTGPGTPMDSLEFVDFSTSLEERLQRKGGGVVDIASVLFDESSPFRSAGALAEHLAVA